MYKVARKEYSAGLVAIHSLRGRGDQSQARDSVPSGTSLVATTGGAVDRQNAAGSRSRRRLVVSLLALALGATLGVAAPQAVAGPEITLSFSPAPSSPNQAIKVTGTVRPVEWVGKTLVLAVQTKSRKGKWTPVRSAKVQVTFTPPAKWMGRFDIEVAGPYWNGLLGHWQGQVTYGSPTVNLNGHYVDYSLTSATGTYKASGTNEPPTSELFQYVGYPWDGAGAAAHIGNLHWCFAASPGRAPADSYEGAAFHKVSGVLVETAYDPPGRYETPDVIRDIEGDFWDILQDTTEPPLLAADGHMRGNVARPVLLAGQGTGDTKSLDWDLAPPSDSPAVVPYHRRRGDYTWAYTPAKKGLYRIQARIGGVASKWVNLTVK